MQQLLGVSLTCYQLFKELKSYRKKWNKVLFLNFEFPTFFPWLKQDVFNMETVSYVNRREKLFFVSLFQGIFHKFFSVVFFIQQEAGGIIIKNRFYLPFIFRSSLHPFFETLTHFFFFGTDKFHENFSIHRFFECNSTRSKVFFYWKAELIFF